MSCLTPVLLRLNQGTESERWQKVRCRVCEDCKQTMRSAAFVRLNAEYKRCIEEHGIVLFFTLTFADEFVPFKFHRMCFDKRLVQEWLQNFRQYFRRYYGYRVKYFLVSELGHVGTHRPHHHGLLFLYKDDKYQLKSWKDGKNNKYIPILPQSFAKRVRDLWQYGRADVQEFDSTKGGIQYVAKYISKFDEEEKLFKDIITRIQIKRGKGTDKSVLYYSKTFPSLHAFMNRYCPFTMISKSLGDSLELSDEQIVRMDKVVIDGFEYNIPRYYSDRYVRKEIKAAQEFVIHDAELSDCDRPSYDLLHTKQSYISVYDHSRNDKDITKPLYLDYHNVRPSDKVLDRYRNVIKTKLFDEVVTYGPMPYYKEQLSYDGKRKLIQVLPKQSEVSQLSIKRREYQFLHLADKIDSMYHNLPQILQDSCSYDIPKLISDIPTICKDGAYQITEFGIAVLHELDELTRVASEWRAKSRLDKMENKRKEKVARNACHGRRPLSWSEYRAKSVYMSYSQKFK